MSDAPDRLARRRAKRRRQVRRRRIAAAAIVVLLAAGVAVAVAATTGDSPPQRAASAPTTTAPTRSILGSGKPVTLAFGGDVHFENLGGALAANPGSVLAGIAPLVRPADLAMVNLETAVTEGGSPAPKQFTFRAPPSAFDAIRAAGIDVVTMANNHGMDYGVEGLRDSLAASQASGVPAVGIGLDAGHAYAPFRKRVHGQRVAIIGATQVLDDNLVSAWTAGPGKPGLASAKDEPRLLEAVREARRSADTLVVFVHWGQELEACPTAAQRELAAALLGAGADIVVGSHAHVLLGAGRMGRGFVDYGLGNLAFYATKPATTQSGVLTVTATGRRIDGYRWSPARISGGVPYPVGGDDAAAELGAWQGLRGCTGLRP